MKSKKISKGSEYDYFKMINKILFLMTMFLKLLTLLPVAKPKAILDLNLALFPVWLPERSHLIS